MSVALIAAAKGYDVKDVQPWVISLKKSGFKGKKFVILYDNNPELINYFKSHNINVVIKTDEGLTHIATQRFRDYTSLLDSDICKDVEYVIHTDIRDVIFQNDPKKWLLENIKGHQIIASGEGIKYRHEDWNGDGLQFQFGEEYFNEFVDYETLCSGVIAGTKLGFMSLCDAMIEISFYANDIGGFIDQHFYNIALRKVFNEVTNFVSPKEPWTANLGTLIAIPQNSPEWGSSPRTPYNSYERFRKGTFEENMLCGLPKMILGKVCTPTGDPYAIVHQYDRYGLWKNELLKIYTEDYAPRLKEEIDDNVTIVTALYDLNRQNWKGFQRSFDNYKAWMKNMLSFNNNMVIFVDEKDVDFVNDCRYGRKDKTVIIPTKFEDFVVEQTWGDKIRTVMKSSEFKNNQTAVGHPQIEFPEYNILMHEKIQFVKKAIELNQFSNDHYMWLDAGVYNINNRTELMNRHYKFNDELLDNKLHLISIEDPKIEDLDLETFYKGHNVRIIGTSWLGHKDAIKKFANTYENLINESLSQNLMDQDQSFLTVSYLRNPGLCKVHKGNWQSALSLWDSKN